ncbi:hypothetical protein Pmani_025224 [Petrolisthes manimaculis]|uniref:Uncharacterized protein n=1 Tax=Petrolisthes manimaculis TaxID=1843537 RepID=A0AAE1TZ57_9EUCA|nr:hypothetical protein Pmani_025224 [Petrolisthes manimaculis]
MCLLSLSFERIMFLPPSCGPLYPRPDPCTSIPSLPFPVHEFLPLPLVPAPTPYTHAPPSLLFPSLSMSFYLYPCRAK